MPEWPAAARWLAARSMSIAIKGGTSPRRDGASGMADMFAYYACTGAAEGCQGQAAFAMTGGPSRDQEPGRMFDDTQPIRLIGMSGSLRTGSYSNAVLETLREKFAGHADLLLYDLAPIPLYNQDFEGDKRPPVVKRLLA